MIHRGRVADFDEQRGLGTVMGDDGSAAPFHCTAVADGSRSVPVGAEVVYEIEPGPGAHLWATNVTVCWRAGPRDPPG